MRHYNYFVIHKCCVSFMLFCMLMGLNHWFQVYRKSLCPVYKEKFMFGLEMNELASRSLVFYLYATDKYTNTLIGEAELKLGDIDFSGSVVTWLLLTDTGQVKCQRGINLCTKISCPTFSHQLEELIYIFIYETNHSSSWRRH